MRNNNFDILHLICALLVIVSHSYALLALNTSEPLWRMTGLINASDIGLCGFFTISGYFILNSLVTSKNIFSYFGKRCLRIFPALAVCLVVVVAACSLFYTGDGSYWGQKETYSFIWRNLGLYDCQWTIPGVFDTNPYPNAIDGSLWTLCYQFTLYLLIIPLFFIRKYRPAIVGLTVAAIVLIMTKNVIFPEKLANTSILSNIYVALMMPFAQCFVVGMLLQGRIWILTDKARWFAIGVSTAVAIILIVLHTYIHTYIHRYKTVGNTLHVGYFHSGWRSVLAAGKRCVQACRRLVVRGVYLQFPDTADDYCEHTRYCTEDGDGFDYCNRFAGGVRFVEDGRKTCVIT